MTIFDRISSLEAKLRFRAVSLAVPEVSEEDIYQGMIEKLITLSQSSNLADQADVYILTQAEWTGRHMRRSALTYNKYIDGETLFADEDGKEISSFELEIDAELTPEESIISEETRREIKEKLTPSQASVLDLLVYGFSKSEIAAMKNISRSAVSQQINGIARKFSLNQPITSHAENWR